MSDKFLRTGGGVINLSNGSANIYVGTLAASGLDPSQPVKTNSLRQLISSKLDIPDINNLSNVLSIKNELTFLEGNAPASPTSGIKIYAKSDGNIYKKDTTGVESGLGGGYQLQITNDPNLINYIQDYELTTFADSTNGNFYNYYSEPIRPVLRIPYNPESTAVEVSDEASFDMALSNNSNNIFITQSFSLFNIKTILHSCKISGDPDNKPILTGNSTSNLIVFDADNVFLENLGFTNANTASNANCINFSSATASNNCIHNCLFNTNEFAIISNNTQIQIYNNDFLFVGSADSHRYIRLIQIKGETLIYNNTFSGNGANSPNTAILLINSNAGPSSFDSGFLVIYKNVSIGPPIQRMAIMETVPINFRLALIENEITTNTDFFILYGDNMLDGFNEIIAYKNEVTLRAGSSGFKGLIGLDYPFSGAPYPIMYCPVVRAALNILPATMRVDYTLLPNSSIENPIIAYSTVKYNTTLTVPIAPLLVGIDEAGGSMAGPLLSSNNSVAFFDGTTGKIIKENTDFKFITGATYGDQLKVPDIETDNHFSVNEELQKIDNFTASVGTVTNIGGLVKVPKIATDRIYDSTDSTFIDLDGTDVSVNATNFLVNGDNLPNQINTLETKTQNINAIAGVTTIAGRIVTDTKVAIGQNAGETTQGDFAVAIGRTAGETGQGIAGIAIGLDAGKTDQKTGALAIGQNAGQITQGASSVALGSFAGNSAQGENSVAIGTNTATTTQGDQAVSIGPSAGRFTQGDYSVAIGQSAGLTTQGANSVAIGQNAGETEQKPSAVAIGQSAGQTGQGTGAVAVGANAGLTDQKINAVAIGSNSGQTSQGASAVAIGENAGQTSQGASAVAIGRSAGLTSQQGSTVALGNNAGRTSQGQYSIAIGRNAGFNNQHEASIILNGTGSIFNATTTGFFVKPLRALVAANPMFYNSVSGEISYVNSSIKYKTNVTDIQQNTEKVYDLQPREYNYIKRPPVVVVADPSYDPDDPDALEEEEQKAPEPEPEPAGLGEEPAELEFEPFTSIGFIAEEVSAIDPFMSVVGEDGPVNIDWNVITTYLVAELKKLRDRVMVLEAR